MSGATAASASQAAGRPRAAPRPRDLVRGWPGAGLAVLLVATVATVMYQGRSGGFYFDDWDFVLRRREWHTAALFLPHNEHLSAVPVLVYKLLFVTVGLQDYWAYRLPLALSHAATIAAIFVYARPRVGPGLALLLPATVAVIGAAYFDLLWAFQLGYSLSLLTGVLAFLALDRGTTRGSLVACALVCVSLGSSSVGLCVLVGVALEVLGTGWRRRWWVVAVPVLLYAGWSLKYRQAGTTVTLENVLEVWRFTGQGLAATVGAVSGQAGDWGRPIALVFVCLLVWRARSYTTIPWRLVALLAVPLSFWAFASFARADEVGAETPRYLYPPAVFLLLIGAEAASGRRLPRRGIALVAVLVLGASLTNLKELRVGGRALEALADQTYGALGALEVAGERIDPAFVPAAGPSPQVTAGPYREAIADFGPVVGGERGIVRSDAPTRQLADSTLQTALGVALSPPAAGARPGPAPAVDGSETAAVEPDASCLAATPQGARGALTITLPDAGVVIEGAADTSVTLRLWGDAFANAPLKLAAAQRVLLRVPDDGATAVWHARVAFGGPVRVCGVG